jgi:hypothetical protein
LRCMLATGGWPWRTRHTHRPCAVSVRSRLTD